MAAGLNSLAESVSMSHSTSCLNLVSAYMYNVCISTYITNLNEYLICGSTDRLVVAGELCVVIPTINVYYLYTIV